MRSAVVVGFLVASTLALPGCDGLTVPLFSVATDPDAAPGSDAGSAPTFGAPTRIGPVSTTAHDTEDPSVTGDALEMYFVSDRVNADFDIYVSRRTSADAGWGTPTAVAELNSTSAEAGPCVSRDGLSIWFDSKRPGGPGNRDLWTSARAARGASWGQPTLVAELDTPADDQKPYVDDAELTLVFESDRDGGAGGTDLYLATRPSLTSPWSAPVPIPGINTTADERDPCLVAAGLQLFYCIGSMSDAGIVWASRTLASAPFGAPTALTALGGSAFDPFVTSDLATIYFAAGPMSTQQIFIARQ
jgi:hypothetical protein